jgi:hypothetical protein
VKLWRVQYAPPESPRLTEPPGGWTPFEGPLERLPRSRRDLYELLGNPGAGKVDRRWRRRSIARIRIPGINPFDGHRLAEPYFREGFRRGFIACPDLEVGRAWAFAFRHQRHDATRPLSVHAWGAAIDIDAPLNRGRYFARGQAPKPGSIEWRDVWPEGLPMAFVRAFCSAGFRWGGDWDGDGEAADHTFVDPMHFELRA